MSGHNKWSTIKHKKGKADAARGKIFTKIIKEITVAARLGGGDMDSNPRLRLAVDKAKASNMPKDNIERAIQKGTGELPGVVYEEVIYEGYGPEGVAVFIEAMTDNKNRTVAEMRYILSKAGGNLGENGSVAWMFDKKGLIVISKEGIGEDRLTEMAIEAGIDDIQDAGENFELFCDPAAFAEALKALEGQGVAIEDSQLTMLPKNSVSLDENGAKKVLKMMDMLEDNDDVQNVFANFDIDDAVMEKLAGE